MPDTDTTIPQKYLVTGNAVLSDGSQTLTADWDAGPHQIRAETFYADVTTGTAPIKCDSTTVCTNLNADLLDGLHSSQLTNVLPVKLEVRVATTAAGTLTSDFENGDTVDGVVLATGNRILIKDQAAGTENGIYTVNASGAPTRAADFNTGDSVAAAFVFVETGTANSDSGWLCTNNAGSDVVATDALVFAKFTGGGDVSGGGSSTDNAIPRWDGATGTTLQDSGVTIGDDDKIKAKATYSDIKDNTDGATVTFDLDLTNKHEVTIAGDRILALSNDDIGQVFMIKIIQDNVGTRTVTWWAGINWPGGTEPTLTTTADKADWFGFVKTGAGSYDGFILGQNL